MLSVRSAGLFAVGASLFLGASSQAADVVVSGLLKREFFSGATRPTVEDGSAGAPTSVGALNSFEAPVNTADNYAQRISGFFTPAASGNYVFFVASDDDSDLFLSTDENPANKRQIANEVQWSNNRGWLNTGDGSDNAGDPSTKRSEPIALVKGKKYYIEGVQHEGGGGDNFSATFKLEVEDDPANGTATRLTGDLISTTLPAGTVTITQQPSDVTTIEGVTATFSVKVDYTGVVAPSYQWSKDGADISGATAASYTTPVLALSDNGKKYAVKVVVPGANATSSTVTLTVNKDTVPPAIVSAGGVKHGSDVDVAVIFDEAIDPASVVAGNFTLSAGTLKSVRYIKNSSTLKSFEQGAVLTTSGLTPGNNYSVTVKNVADAKGNKVASASANFKVSPLVWTALGAGDTAEFPAAALAVAENGFNLNSGGNAYWGTSDDVTFVYEEITGDFDKIARVEGQDASSQWARAGITARATLDSGDTASRYQQVHVNPTIKADGGGSNYSYETNRRLNTGGATSSSSGGGTPAYPHAWLRLRREGDVLHMYRSDDAVTFYEFNPTNFNPADGSNPDGPLPAKMYVGPVFGPENGNLDAAFRSVWTAKFRDYGDYQPNKARGKQTYSIGVSFQDGNDGNSLGPKEVAGVGGIAQANWNNIPALATSEAPVALGADVAGVAKSTSATVEWTCPNTWESTGRGEENNAFTGSDRALMKGYLDTGGATTTKVTISNIPAELTGAAGGYDVVLYALGGVSDRGGGYRITDLNGTELKPVILVKSPKNPTAFEKAVPTDPAVHVAATYIVFKGLTAKGIIVEASTENGYAFGGTPRASLNAIQLAVPTGAVDAVAVTPTISIAGNKITFTGTLQQSATVNGTYSNVAGATSPYTVPTGAAAGFYRSAQ